MSYIKNNPPPFATLNLNFIASILIYRTLRNNGVGYRKPSQDMLTLLSYAVASVKEKDTEFNKLFIEAAKLYYKQKIAAKEIEILKDQVTENTPAKEAQNILKRVIILQDIVEDTANKLTYISQKYKGDLIGSN